MGGTVIKPQAQIILERGIEQGEIRAKKKTAVNLARKGMSEDAIADIIEVSMDIVKQWLEG